jgi:hypothetical protein
MLQDYQSLAMRTAKTLPTFHLNLMHAGIGLGTEVGELAETIACAWMQLPVDGNNISEEIGDASWYGALLCDVMSWEFHKQFAEPAVLADMSPTLASAVLGRNPVALQLCLTAFAAEVQGVVKSHVIYGKELDHTKLERALTLFLSTASLLADLHGLDYEAVLTSNIQKLRKRYPDKYTDDAAIARLDKVETGETPSIILSSN